MLKDIETLPYLGKVRQRLGATDAWDKSFDEKIREMNPRKYVRAFCGWELGDESWADEIIDTFLAAQEAEEEP